MRQFLAFCCLLATCWAQSTIHTFCPLEVSCTWTSTQTFPDLITSSTPVVDVRASRSGLAGAVCDGSTDDTAAIQRAINAAYPTNATVLFPAASCAITGSLVLPDLFQCANLKGAGVDSTILIATATISGGMISKSNVNTTFGCSIKGMTLNGNVKAANGLLLKKGKEWQIEEVKVIDTTSDPVQLGETFAGAEFYEELVRGLYIEFTSGNFTAGSQPNYGLHGLSGATDSRGFYGVVVKNAKVAGIRMEGGGNVFFGAHVYGFPTTYASTYSFEDAGGRNQWIGSYADTPATSGFHISANDVTITGGLFLWPDTTTFPTANLLTVDTGITGLNFTNSGCHNMNGSATPITYADGSPAGPATVFGVTGCTTFMNEYIDTQNRDLVIGGSPTSPGARLTVTTTSDNVIPLEVKARASGSMSVPVQQWKNELNTAVASVDHNGLGTFAAGVGPRDNSFGSNQFNNASACEATFGITTLGTGATTTDTTNNCLPANSVIDAVVYRITTTITTAASFTIGDATTAARFCGTQSTLTAGTTGICFVQADQTGAAGPRQTSAAKVRVTSNVNPGAGAIRLIVYYHTWTAPTS